MEKGIDLSNRSSPYSLKVRIARVLWVVVYYTLFRFSPNPLRKWRVFILRLFGGDVSYKARVSSSAIISMPWNLHMEEYAVLGPKTICYCTEAVHIGSHSVVSQYSYLCTATHDYEDQAFPLYARPVVIKESAWICADVFVGPGVIIGSGAVVGARSSVYKDVPSWKVCVGNPAKAIKDRVIIPKIKQ